MQPAQDGSSPAAILLPIVPPVVNTVAHSRRVRLVVLHDNREVAQIVLESRSIIVEGRSLCQDVVGGVVGLLCVLVGVRLVGAFVGALGASLPLDLGFLGKGRGHGVYGALTVRIEVELLWALRFDQVGHVGSRGGRSELLGLG